MRHAIVRLMSTRRQTDDRNDGIVAPFDTAPRPTDRRISSFSICHATMAPTVRLPAMKPATSATPYRIQTSGPPPRSGWRHSDTEHREESRPGPDFGRVRLSHDARHLSQVTEIVGHPGSEELLERDRAELRVATTAGQVRRRQAERPQAGEARRAQPGEGLEQLRERLAARGLELGEPVERRKGTGLAVGEDDLGTRGSSRSARRGSGARRRRTATRCPAPRWRGSTARVARRAAPAAPWACARARGAPPPERIACVLRGLGVLSRAGLAFGSTRRRSTTWGPTS